MNISRRCFVGAGVAATAVSLNPIPLFGQNQQDNPEIVPDEVMFALLDKAVDAATSMGAAFAEASVSRQLSDKCGNVEGFITGSAMSEDFESLSFGVRVAIGGRWGFASSNTWSTDEAVRLAGVAMKQAKANSVNKNLSLDLAPIPTESGRWVSPGIDPFSVSREEKIDLINAWRVGVLEYRNPIFLARLGQQTEIVWMRNEFAYANSSGCRQSQMFYEVDSKFSLVGAEKKGRALSDPPAVYARGVGRQQAGWEVFRNAKLHEQIPYLVEKSVTAAHIGGTPVDIGRYDVVCDSKTVAGILSTTLGKAAQLDIALGYEANAGGTSYLGPNPMGHLGQMVAHESITISGNRSLSKGLATAKWDHEGVATKEFDLVRDGVLVDYQTNRETALQIREWYRKQGKEPLSNACASASSSEMFPLTAMPNLRIQPSDDSGVTTESLIGDIKKGYFLDSFYTTTSFQGQDGLSVGKAREIINGKLGNYVPLEMMFSSTELWNSVIGIGDSTTINHIAVRTVKGQPRQVFHSTIEAVPISFANVAIIEPGRKV